MATTRPKPKRYLRRKAARLPCVHGVAGIELRPHQVLIRPLVTEKGTHQSSKYNAYTFEVNPLANKILSGEFSQGDTVGVDTDGVALTFQKS